MTGWSICELFVLMANLNQPLVPSYKLKIFKLIIELSKEKLTWLTQEDVGIWFA